MYEHEKYFETLQNLRQQNKPFAQATVISVKGSASAKPGSKAIFNEHGQNIWGWVGGGCAESFVAQNAIECMKTRETKIVEADLDDEIFGLGMPCGGHMIVYIEPQIPNECIDLECPKELKDIFTHLCKNLGISPNFKTGKNEMKVSEIEYCVYSVAKGISKKRNTNFESLVKNKNMFLPKELKLNSIPKEFSELLIVGSTRITEELAKLGSILKWPVRVYGPHLEKQNYPENATLVEADEGFLNFTAQKNSAVIIASHHKGDCDFIKKSLVAGACYIGLIASAKRSMIILEHLRKDDVNQNLLSQIFAPAGLDLECKNPQEIALSCFSEMIFLKNKVDNCGT